MSSKEYDAYKAFKNPAKYQHGQDGFITGPVIRENEKPTPKEEKPYWRWTGKEWIINK